MEKLTLKSKGAKSKLYFESTPIPLHHQFFTNQMKMKAIKNSILSLALVAVTVSNLFAQERPIYEVHSMMIYNFIKYIEWPTDTKNGDFIIGVYGDQDVFNALNKWYGGKDKMGQKIVVKLFNNPSEIAKCHIVYLAGNRSNDFEAVKNRMKGSNTLMVTDNKGLAHKGSGINFKMEGNKLKFELNQSSVQAANLKVSSQLSSMAILI
jgi:hypothetical protein